MISLISNINKFQIIRYGNVSTDPLGNCRGPLGSAEHTLGTTSVCY